MTFTQTLWKLLILSLLATTLALGMVACSGDDDDDTANDDDDTTCELTEADCVGQEQFHEEDCACDCHLAQADCAEGETVNADTCECEPEGACELTPAVCAGEADDDDDDCTPTKTETDCPGDIAPVGDITCKGTVPDPVPPPYTVNTTTCECETETVTLTGKVEDFQTEAPVGGAVMTVDGTNITATSQPSGNYELVGVPANRRINIKITAAGYKETWQYQVLVNAEDPTDNFVVVANSTYNLVQGLWGIVPNPDNCVIAGQVTDCAGDNLSGYGISATSCPDDDTAVKWFSSKFPSAAQCPASDDGLYGVVNIAPPDVVIQVIGNGGDVLVEAGPVPCVPGAIGVFNLEVGRLLP